MSFQYEEECEVKFEFEPEELALKVIDFCLEYAEFPYEAEVNLTLTDNAGIHEINKNFRNIDRATDVLSFPMLSYDTLLGDIVISVDKVKEQAESYGHSTRREFAFLIVHSMLHLFGYDHMEEQEAAVMEQKQKEILDKMEIFR